MADPLSPGAQQVAAAIAGKPYARFWSPDKEGEFQSFMAFDPSVRAWRNGFRSRFGESPQIEGGDFDYRAAYLAGDRPQPVPNDSVWHWPSTGKSVDHPTAWKQEFMARFGVDPDAAIGGGQTTPDMDRFINDAFAASQSMPLATGRR